MSYPVQLYIYDLSNGMARMLSRQLTGTHFDAIYHTSVVVHGVEWFFGAGIQSASPGQTHHGAPMEIHPLGNTALDAQGVAQLVRELAPRFQASDYHLLRHNCNNFSDVLGRRLTGQGVPAHVSSLPSDFLSTPFGQMMAPQIDAMFRPAGASGATPHASTSSLGSALVQNVAQSAMAPASASTSTLRLSSGAAVQQLLASEPCVALLVSSSGAGATERIAQAHPGVAFATCDASSLPGAQAGRVSFFLSGEKLADCAVSDLPGLQRGFAELQGRVWTRHPHADLALPSLASLPQSPITFTAVPSFPSLVQKLDSFVAACPAPSFDVKAALQDARKVVVKETIPWLERHAKSLQSAPAMSSTSAQAFQRAAQTLQQHLGADQLFPLLDITRLLLLHPPFVASLGQTDALLPGLLQRAAESESRPTVLTATRLLANALVHPPLRTTLHDRVRQLPAALLYADAAVRSAAASASFNAGLGVSHRLPLVRLPDAPAPAAAQDDDWDVELAPALLEAAQREESDETLHRILAALLLVLHNSPRWTNELGPMLQVLDAAEHCGTLLRKRPDAKLQPLLKDLVAMCGAA